MMIQLKNHVEESKKSRVRNWLLYGRVTLHFSMPPCHPATMLLYVHPGHCSLGGRRTCFRFYRKANNQLPMYRYRYRYRYRYIHIYVCMYKEGITRVERKRLTLTRASGSPTSYTVMPKSRFFRKISVVVVRVICINCIT